MPGCQVIARDRGQCETQIHLKLNSPATGSKVVLHPLPWNSCVTKSLINQVPTPAEKPLRQLGVDIPGMKHMSQILPDNAFRHAMGMEAPDGEGSSCVTSASTRDRNNAHFVLG